MRKLIGITLAVVLHASYADAMFTEIGINYLYKKSFIDTLNSIEQQGATGSLSFYFWERVAIELSYTNSIYISRQKDYANSNPTAVRTTTQLSDIYGCDVIYVFADRKATFQPYVKGGGAYLKKRMYSQVDGDVPTPTQELTGWAPSYGLGLKLFLSEAMALRMGLDVLRTPQDTNVTTEDVTGKIGLSWLF